MDMYKSFFRYVFSEDVEIRVLTGKMIISAVSGIKITGTPSDDYHGYLFSFSATKEQFYRLLEILQWGMLLQVTKHYAEYDITLTL